MPFDESFLKRPVIIEDNVWIGMNVTISPGTKIGEGAIIGLGSSVFGTVPKLAIIGQNKPLIIKYRDEKHYNFLVNNNSFCKEDGKKY